MFELGYSFWIDAAHTLSSEREDRSHYSRLHGHSFHVTVSVRGPMTQSAWVMDFGDIEEACERVRSKLHSTVLNDVPGLGVPTLENLCKYIWNALRDIGALYCVEARRDSLGQHCRYYGPI